MALPTDQDVHNNETFKKQGFAVGGKVAAVRSSLFYIQHFAHALKTLPFSTPLDYTPHTFPSPGNLSFLFPLPYQLR